MGSQMDLMDTTMAGMKGILREMYLDHHLEMTMESQMDLMDTTMAGMKGIPRDMNLDHH